MDADCDTVLSRDAPTNTHVLLERERVGKGERAARGILALHA